MAVWRCERHRSIIAISTRSLFLFNCHHPIDIASSHRYLLALVSQLNMPSKRTKVKQLAKSALNKVTHAFSRSRSASPAPSMTVGGSEPTAGAPALVVSSETNPTSGSAINVASSVGLNPLVVTSESTRQDALVPGDTVVSIANLGLPSVPIIHTEGPERSTPPGVDAALDIASTVLDTLKSVADFSPVPFLSPAASAALGIIKTIKVRLEIFILITPY